MHGERELSIHFVCTGNVYRSRLAEAYCASRCGSGIRISSSGIAAGASGDAAISPYAADVLAQYSLGSYAAAGWQRTTPALVQASDVLVFMESVHRQFCADWIVPGMVPGRQRIEVWGIEDIGQMDTVAQIPDKVQRTFVIIRRQTDALLSALGLSNVSEMKSR
jgi:protein-tyrosine-phosphatase